jgi:hypothetical protein
VHEEPDPAPVERERDDRVAVGTGAIGPVRGAGAPEAPEAEDAALSVHGDDASGEGGTLVAPGHSGDRSRVTPLCVIAAMPENALRGAGAEADRDTKSTRSALPVPLGGPPPPAAGIPTQERRASWGPRVSSGRATVDHNAATALRDALKALRRAEKLLEDMDRAAGQAVPVLRALDKFAGEHAAAALDLRMARIRIEVMLPAAEDPDKTPVDRVRRPSEQFTAVKPPEKKP